jgi:hypothetical protein
MWYAYPERLAPAANLTVRNPRLRLYSTWSNYDINMLLHSHISSPVLSTILNRRILGHLEVFCGHPVATVNELWARSGVICGLSAADILMGNFNARTSIDILFPRGETRGFIEYLERTEGYEVAELRATGITALKHRSMDLHIWVYESGSSDPLDPADQFPATCSCIFVGPGWYRIWYYGLFVERHMVRIRSEAFLPFSQEMMDEWAYRQFTEIEIDGFRRWERGDQPFVGYFDRRANVRLPGNVR